MIILTALSVTEYQNAFAENDTNYITVFIVFTTMFAVVLVKKDTYPDVFTFGYYRN